MRITTPRTAPIAAHLSLELSSLRQPDSCGGTDRLQLDKVGVVYCVWLGHEVVGQGVAVGHIVGHAIEEGV